MLVMSLWMCCLHPIKAMMGYRSLLLLSLINQSSSAANNNSQITRRLCAWIVKPNPYFDLKYSFEVVTIPTDPKYVKTEKYYQSSKMVSCYKGRTRCFI